MQYFTEQAASHREALEAIKAKYGDQAQVLSHKTIRVGGFLGLFAREGVEVTGYIRQVQAPAEQRAASQAARPAAPPAADFEEEKRKILAQARSDQALQQVLAEIRGIKERLDEGELSGARAASDADDHDTIRRIDALLALNDFSEGFRREAVARLRRDFSLEELRDVEEVESAALEWIGDSIRLWTGSQSPAASESSLSEAGRAGESGRRLGGRGQTGGRGPEGRGPEGRGPRVLALVGPTGVGKTTTIAKLAAIHAVGIGDAGDGPRAGLGSRRPQSVRMITIDNYRIGARQQIETYGDIMGVPVSCVETAEDLRETIAMYSDADLILVDTVGKSPRDAVKLAEMQRILAACGSDAEIHLALSATTKGSDMVQIMRQFEPFDYKAVILTKLDETNRVGNAISALAERGKALSYVTNGQSVPQNIERARVTRLLMNLEGFRVDRPRFEARYGEERVVEQDGDDEPVGGPGEKAYRGERGLGVARSQRAAREPKAANSQEGWS